MGHLLCRFDTYSLSLDAGETTCSTLTGHSLHTGASLTTGGTTSTSLSLHKYIDTLSITELFQSAAGDNPLEFVHNNVK